MWMHIIGYHHFNFFPINFLLLKVFFYQSAFIIKNIGVKVQKSFTKTKIQFIKLNDLKKNLQHSYKSFNTNFFDQNHIKMTLHKYFWQNWQFCGHETWFLICLTMIAPNTSNNAFKFFIIMIMVGIKLEVLYGLHFIGPNYLVNNIAYRTHVSIVRSWILTLIT
jgi:hypothetical protein